MSLMPYRAPYGMGGLSGLGTPMDPTMLHHRIPAYPGKISSFAVIIYTLCTRSRGPTKMSGPNVHLKV